MFVGHFCPPGSRSRYGSWDPLNPDPIRIRSHSTEFQESIFLLITLRLEGNSREKGKECKKRKDDIWK